MSVELFSDAALIQEFVTESAEHLAAIEPDLLLLERDGANSDPETVNRIFRAIHSIKGASGFFGFERLKSLSHVMENLLMQVRDRQIDPTPAVVEPLLVGVDKLNAMIGDIQGSEEMSIEDEMQLLNAVLNPKQAPSAEGVLGEAPLEEFPEASVSSLEPACEKNETSPCRNLSNPEDVNYLLVNGQFLYEVTLPAEAQGASFAALWENVATVGTVFGRIGASVSSLEEASAYSDTRCYIATVLEADLLAFAAGLPEDALQRLDLKTFSLTVPERVDTSSESSPGVGLVPEQKVPAASPSASRRASASGGEGSDSIRVRVDLLNRLMELAGEMVLSRNQLVRAFNQSQAQDAQMEGIIQSINHITTDLQEHIMQTRMQPIGSVFSKFPRIVRDMSKQLGKEIELLSYGDDVELDKTIIESLSDPLTHIIRNGCDHAIELPDVRREKGKPAKGTLILRAYHQDGQINIEISDDGKGIDTARICRKAIDAGLLQEADAKKMSQQEMAQLIFMPGLSTAEQVTDLSGRGVGMDVVKTNITRLGGHINVETTPGEGTRFILRLPLTLAIIPSLIVGVCGHRFAMPQVNLVELIRVRATDIPTRIEKVGNASVLRLRGKLLPLLRLADILNLQRSFIHPETGEVELDRRGEITDARLESEGASANRRETFASDYNIMVLKMGSHQFGLIVDELFDTEEIVVKPLSAFLKHSRCFSGATIMGDGKVAMILDPGGILAQAGLSFEQIEAAQHQLNRKQQEEEARRGTLQSVLLFENSAGEHFAVPLSLVKRIERIAMADIRRMGAQEMINFYGSPLPLLRLEQLLPVGAASEAAEYGYLIIPKSGHAGILAARIVDNLETDVLLEAPPFRKPGVLGAAILQQQLTLFLDPEVLIQHARVREATSHAI